MADKTEILGDRGRGRGQDSGQCGDSEPGDATLSRGSRRGPGGSRRVNPTVHFTDMNVKIFCQAGLSWSVAIMIILPISTVQCCLFVKLQVDCLH